MTKQVIKWEASDCTFWDSQETCDAHEKWSGERKLWYKALVEARIDEGALGLPGGVVKKLSEAGYVVRLATDLEG